jgi:hypothetical protein
VPQQLPCLDQGNRGASVGISVEDYDKRWNARSENEQYFSCVTPPISVSYGDKLTSGQREVVIRRAEAKFGVNP